MAKGRMVSTGIATDKMLNSLSIEAEYLFLKAIPHIDKDGLILADTTILYAKICPRRTDMIDKIDPAIDEWVNAGLVIAYETDDGRALYFPGFSKNNTIRHDREGKSKIPPPPGYIRTEKGLVEDGSQQDSGATPDEVRTNDGVSPGKVKVREGNVKEGNASETPAPADSDSVSARFSFMHERAGQTKSFIAQPDKLKTWFEEVTMDYSRTDFEKAVSKMAKEKRNGGMDGMRVWERTQWHLENPNGSKGGIPLFTGSEA